VVGGKHEKPKHPLPKKEGIMNPLLNIAKQPEQKEPKPKPEKPEKHDKPV
jgi:hypothetical protein